jgi:predicted nucleic acid-binding protein
MSGRAFYDTNVLACAHDGSSPAKQRTAQELIKRGLRDRSIALSIQVFSEYYVVATRKLGISPVEVLREMHVLSRAEVVEPTLGMVFQSVALAEANGLSYWDALIVTSAAAAGCDTLYTEDLSHGQTVAGVRVVDPFRAATS